MKIIFFDGHCTLCNASVDWLIRIDKRKHLKFASLQGETAAKMLDKHHKNIDTAVYLDEGKIYERSTAILRAMTDIGGIWSATRILLIIPAPIRDAVYRFIATNRYRIFKRNETCRAPTLEERERILP